TGASVNAIDRGTAELPASLVALLVRFGVQDERLADRYDIGPYETGYAVQAVPAAGAIQPGIAVYTLRTLPPDAGATLTLGTEDLPPDVVVEMESTEIPPGGETRLTMISRKEEPQQPGEWRTVTITATNQAFIHATTLDLLVGGWRVYLPEIHK
ncbi:MAG: hypothetical protein D6759_10440, partial [Chloroflexi bacterium]